MLKELLIKCKVAEIMVKILEAEEDRRVVYPSMIAKEVNLPLSYVSKILSELERFAVIESEFEGRRKILKFTDDGRKLAKKIKDLLKILEFDFLSRSKISKLKEIYDKSSKDFRSLAGILAEVERLKCSEDLKVLREVKKLEKKIWKAISDERRN
ncbi:MAG: ArsR family transcriptional regulator [Archaeoglobales archaeon]|nr:MAG: ArsR family transcriptional regulator [Archaeoglobales archaeon]